MNKQYKILLSASLLTSFADNLIGPFYAVFVERIGGDILDIGFTATVFSLSTGILIILIGKLSDKIKKELITTLGYLFFAIGSFGYLIISHPWQLFILQIVFALGTACLSAPLSALFAKFIQKGKEGFEWGLEGGGVYLAVGLAVFVGTLIVNYFGFKILFIAMFSIQVLATLIQTRILVTAKK
ncbi:MFS transporter [Patescibacteria group bacterium]